MKLTMKDRVFLEKLRELLDEQELSIELKENGMRRLVLRRNYGSRIDYVQKVLMLSYWAKGLD